jgi:glycosyltransferase involved in cell wall biosynthesis
MPLVTVGLPVYNSERFLRQSIESLLAQTYGDFAMVISDNASTDATPEICQEYARLDSRIQYVQNPRNIGLSANFNRVFELTRTTYLKWSTADDYWAPQMLRDAVDVLEGDPSVVLVYPRTTLVNAASGEEKRYDDQLHLVSDDPVERFLTLLTNIRLCHQHLGLIRTDAIRRTHLLGPHVGSDQAFLAELTLYGKFFEIPQYYYFRRIHPDSSSWNRQSSQHQARRYHPSGVDRVRFNRWKYHGWFFKAVGRSPLGVMQKARLTRALLKEVYWDRARLRRDLMHQTA